MNRQTATSARKGFTLLEAVVVVIIIAVILALLLPAISTSRIVNRRAQCVDNLRQLGIGLDSYHRSFDVLPAAMGGTGNWPADAEDLQTNQGRLSGLVALLPFMEQQALWEELQAPAATNAAGKPYASMGPVPWDQHFKPWATQIPDYRCPSDESQSGSFGLTNYTFCIGDRLVNIHSSENPRGAFAGSLQRSYSDITDGLSHTIAICEIGTDRGDRSIPGQYVVDQGVQYLFKPGRTRGMVDSNGGDSYKKTFSLSDNGRGSRWADGAAGYGLVNTVLPPNSPSVAINGHEMVDGLFSAGSYHRGGCHVAMADGAVTFVTNSIDYGSTGQTAKTNQVAPVRSDDPIRSDNTTLPAGTRQTVPAMSSNTTLPSAISSNVTVGGLQTPRAGGNGISEAPLPLPVAPAAVELVYDLEKLHQDSHAASRFGVWGALGTASGNEPFDGLD